MLHNYSISSSRPSPFSSSTTPPPPPLYLTSPHFGHIEVVAKYEHEPSYIDYTVIIACYLKTPIPSESVGCGIMIKN